MAVIQVEFDHGYWKNVQALLEAYFNKYIVAEILTGRVKAGRLLFEESNEKVAKLTEGTEDEDVADILDEEEIPVDIPTVKPTGEVVILPAARCGACHTILREPAYVADDNSNGNGG